MISGAKEMWMLIGVVLGVLVVILVLDLYVLLRFGLPLFDQTIQAEGDFLVPIVGAVAGLGAAYAYYRNRHQGFALMWWAAAPPK
jgi:hypothetical protein